MPLFDLGYRPNAFVSPKPGYGGTPLQHLFSRFPDEDSCLQHIFESRLLDYGPCPRCGSNDLNWRRARRSRNYVHDCGHRFSPLEDTVFGKSRLPLRIWFYALLHAANNSEGTNTAFAARHFGCHHRTAQRMLKRIRVHLAALDAEKKVGGNGQYVSIRVQNFNRVCVHGARENKVAVIIGSDAEKVYSRVIFRRSAAALDSFIKARVSKGSKLITECFETYRLSANYGRRAPKLTFTPPARLVGSESLNRLIGFKMYFDRTHFTQHQTVWAEHFWTYLCQIQFRYNRRNSPDRIFWDMITRFPLQTTSATNDLVALNSSEFAN